MAERLDRKASGKKQLRGVALEERIRKVIQELSAEASENGQKYVFNASEVARRVGTTRKTLRNHDEVVEKVLGEIDSPRRISNGETTIENLGNQVKRLKERLAEKEQELNALRSHHVELYSKLHLFSVDGACLVEPILRDESQKKGKCILCGSHPSEWEEKSPTVVDFNRV